MSLPNLVTINEKFRLSEDERHWLLQRKSGKGWETLFYMTTSAPILRHIREYCGKHQVKPGDELLITTQGVLDFIDTLPERHSRPKSGGNK